MNNNNLVDNLRKNRVGGHVAFAEFIRHRHKAKKDLHIFVEGRDDPAFYGKFINDIRPTHGRRFYLCGNKDGVVSACRKVEANQSTDYLTLFLSDRDLDDYCGFSVPDSVFRTKNYSIESYFVSERLIGPIICEMNSGSFIDPEHLDRCSSDFPAILRSFSLKLRVVMAFMVHCKIKSPGMDSGASMISIAKYFSISDGKLFYSGGMIKDLERITGISYSRPEVTAIARKLKPEDSLRWSRGKWIMWIFFKHIELGVEKIKETNPDCKIANRIGQSNAILVLISRLSCPDDLRQYVDQRVPLRTA